MLTQMWDGSKPSHSSASASADTFKRVSMGEIPHMSFKGYQALANLEAETRDHIRASQEYPVRVYEAPYRIFEDPREPERRKEDKKKSSYLPPAYYQSQQMQNLTLFKSTDAELGTFQHCVRAARNLRKGVALCFVGGQLTEQWKVEDHVAENECFLMRSNELHDYFEYPRDGPNIVLQMNNYYNISKFIRDPSFRKSGEGPNVAIDLILHPKAHVFVVVLYTLEEIVEGTEIFCARFVGSSKKGQHQNMVLAARVAHYYHRYAVELEKAAERAQLNMRQLKEWSQTPSKGVQKLLTSQEQRLHMRGVDAKQKSVPIPSDISKEEHEERMQRMEVAKKGGRSTKREKDVTAGRNLYAFFAKRMREQLLTNGNVSPLERTKIIALAWRDLTQHQKDELRATFEKEACESGTTDAAAAHSSSKENNECKMAVDSDSDAELPVLVSPLTPNISSLNLQSNTNRAQATISDSSSSTVAAKSSPLPLPPPSSSSSNSAGAAAGAAASIELGGQTSGTIRRDLMKLMDTKDAFESQGCIQIARSTLGKSVKQTTRIALARIDGPQYPEVIVIDGEKYPFDVVTMQKLLDEKVGYEPEKLEVREILSLSSPCRYFCPPWYRSFCVVSKMTIEKGELLVIYSGEMEQQVQHRCSSYVYSLPTREGVSQFGPAYNSIPDLIIDAAAKGNIGRFINDNSFRNGKYQDENVANIGVTWVFDHAMPHLVFYAKKRIEKGEELISSYGQEFWDVMCQQSMRGQSAYYNFIRPYTTKLENLLKHYSVPLPPKPDVVVERDPLFREKTIPYYPPPEDSDEENDDDVAEVEEKSSHKKRVVKREDEDEEDEEEEGEDLTEYQVERIVGKKFLPEDGSVRYLLKWLHFDEPDDNTWEPLECLESSMDLVSEFERKLAALGLEEGVEPLQAPAKKAQQQQQHQQQQRHQSQPQQSKQKQTVSVKLEPSSSQSDEDDMDDDGSESSSVSTPPAKAFNAQLISAKRQSYFRNPTFETKQTPSQKTPRGSRQPTSFSIDLTQDAVVMEEREEKEQKSSIQAPSQATHSKTPKKGRKRMPSTTTTAESDESSSVDATPSRKVKRKPNPTQTNSAAANANIAAAAAATTSGSSSSDSSPQQASGGYKQQWIGSFFGKQGSKTNQRPLRTSPRKI